MKKKRSRQPSKALARKLDEIAALVEEGDIEEALERMERLAQRHEDVGEVHLSLSGLYLAVNRADDALIHAKKAVALEPERAEWLLPLTVAYMENEMQAHAVKTLRKFVRLYPDHPEIEQVKVFLAELEGKLKGFAAEFGVKPQQVEKARLAFENGRWEVEQGNFEKGVRLFQKTLALLPDFVPALNNLSLALFFAGEPQEAIAIEERVLREIDGDNVNALVNLIRFQLSCGRWEEARRSFDHLKTQAHPHHPDWMKVAEGYALMGEDEGLYGFLSLVRFHRGDLPPSALFWAGVAAANTGRKEMALRYWGEAWEAGYDEEFVEKSLLALQQGKKGIGDAEKFSYFRPAEIAPRKALEEFYNLFRRKGKLGERYREEVERLVGRYPSLMWALTQMLWEEEEDKQPIIIVLRELASPSALEALRRFAFSQAGNDDDRMAALFALAEAGEIPEGQPVKMWLDGEWQEITPRRYQIVPYISSPYTKEIQAMLDKADSLSERGKDKEAEQLYWQVLEKEPRAKEAYYNLARLFNERGDREAAEGLFQKVLEIDPLDVYARCSLAMMRLEDGKVGEAKEILRPLAQRTQFHPEDMGFYLLALAHVAIQEGDYGQALHHLEAGLSVDPDNEELQELWEWLALEGLAEEFSQKAREGKRKGRRE